MTIPRKAWTLADAKAHLSEVGESALKKGPQVITRHGRETVVVVAVEEWNRKARHQGTLADFFAASPLRDSGLEVERPQAERSLKSEGRCLNLNEAPQNSKGPSIN